jgi:multiple sugar transport system permease protein
LPNTPIAGGSSLEVALPQPTPARASWRERVLESERFLALALLLPAVTLLLIFIAYPFVMGIWFSLTSISVGNPGEFVGLKNFIKVWNDSIFQEAFRNTVYYTSSRRS